MIIMSLPHVNGYDVIEKIGVGSFSSVYKAYSKGPFKTLVAIKCIDKRYQKKSFADSVVKEISFLKVLKHEYIVSLTDFLWDAKHIFIVMEYCNEGDLSQYIRKKHKLFEALVKIFMQQLGLALQFLHQHNICHMDLKPQNLLLQSKPKLKLKLADFGLSQYISTNNEHCRFAGSILYMAPEKLLNLQFDSRVDLWSVGIIMYECLFGRPPYIKLNTKTIIDLMQKRTPIELPHNACISGKCNDLLTRLLKHNPNERIQFQDYFKHPFLELEYLPTKENYEKVVAIIKEAIELDKKKNYNESLAKYREGIKYVQAFLASETDANKKMMLNHKLNEYIQWANVLSEYLKNSSSVPNDLYQPLPLSDNHFETLCELATVTPNLASALDIGSSGELFFIEGKHKIALEKITIALEMLLPILANEPVGVRKEMIHLQIKKWLSIAETLKKAI